MDTNTLNEMLPSSLKSKNNILTASWQTDNGSYVSRVSLCIGRVKVASFFYDGGVSKDDNNKYKVISTISGINPNLGHFKTEKEAAEKCIIVGITFVKMLCNDDKSNSSLKEETDDSKLLQEHKEVIRQFVKTYVIDVDENGEPKSSMSEMLMLIERANKLIQ